MKVKLIERYDFTFGPDRISDEFFLKISEGINSRNYPSSECDPKIGSTLLALYFNFRDFLSGPSKRVILFSTPLHSVSLSRMFS